MHHRDSQKVVYKKNQSSLLFQLFVLGLLGFFPLVLGLEGFFWLFGLGAVLGFFGGTRGCSSFMWRFKRQRGKGRELTWLKKQLTTDRLRLCTLRHGQLRTLFSFQSKFKMHKTNYFKGEKTWRATEFQSSFKKGCCSFERSVSTHVKPPPVPFFPLISLLPLAVWPCAENREGYWHSGSCCSRLCMQRT